MAESAPVLVIAKDLTFTLDFDVSALERWSRWYEWYSESTASQAIIFNYDSDTEPFLTPACREREE